MWPTSCTYENAWKDGFCQWSSLRPQTDEEEKEMINEFIYQNLVYLNTPKHKDSYLDALKQAQKDENNKRNLIYKLKQKWNSIF